MIQARSVRAPARAYPGFIVAQSVKSCRGSPSPVILARSSALGFTEELAGH